MANTDLEEKIFNLEIFSSVNEEVVAFEIVRDILDNVADLQVIYVNDAFLTQNNATLDETKGITLTELYGEEIAENYLKTAVDVVNTGEGKKYEAYFKSSDKFYSVSAFSPDDDMYITISSDITKLKKALDKTEEVFENMDEVYFQLDNSWQFISANSKIKSFMGIEKNEITGKNIWDDFGKFKDSEFYIKFNEAKNNNIEIIFNAMSPETEEWYKVHAYPYPDRLEVYLKNINHEKLAQKELEDLKIKFKTLFEENNNAVIISDIKTGKYVNVNPKAEELTGYSKEELLSMGTGAASNDLKEMAIKELRELSNEGNIKIETEIQTRDKGFIPIEISTSIIEKDDNVYSLSVLKDISTIKKEEDEKIELQEQMDQYMQELKVWKEKYNSLNNELSAAQEDKSELNMEIKQHIHELKIAKEELKFISEELSVAEQDKKELKEEMEKRIEELILSRKNLESNSQKIEEVNKKLKNHEEMLLKTKQKLQKSEAQYKSLAENLSSVIMRYDNDFKVIYLAPSAEHMTDVSVDEFIGKTNREVGMPEEICDLWESTIENVFETGKTHEIQFEFPSSDNSHTKSFHLKFIPEFGEDGVNVQYVLGISTDITRTKKAEIEKHELKKEIEQLTGELQASKKELKTVNKELQIANEDISKQEINIINIKKALHQSELESLHLLIEMEAIYNSAPVGLCTLDHDLHFMRVNKKLAEISGLPAEDHIGKTIHEIIPHIGEHVEDIVQFIFKNGLPVLDVEFKSKNDPLKTWNTQWIPLKDIDGNINGISVAAQDITPVVDIENRLKETESHYNNEIKEQGLNFKEEYNALLEDHSIINGIIECSNDPVAAWNTDYEFIFFNKAYKELYKKLGKDVESGMNIKNLLLDSPEDELEAIQLWKRALNGEIFTVEMVFEIDSKNVFYEIVYYPIKDKQGNIIGASHLARNITERQRSEKRLKEHVEDMKISSEDLDKFISKPPEDFQESLEQIINALELFDQEDKYKNNDKLEEELDSQMQMEVDDTADYSSIRANENGFNFIYTNSMLNHVINDLKPLMDENNVKITHDTLPNVRGDAGKLQHMFHELISNAIKFKSKNKPLEINISSKKQNNKYIFSIIDNGTGAEEQYADGEFDLSGAEEIIKRHGGSIWTESIPGQGSILYFTILQRKLRESV